MPTNLFENGMVQIRFLLAKCKSKRDNIWEVNEIYFLYG